MEEKTPKQGMQHGFQIILVGPQHIEFQKTKIKRTIAPSYLLFYLQ
jgi:hypothetical protein